jgi:hypothetical protein
MPTLPTGDPLLKGAVWRARCAYWRASKAPCARCGGYIDRSRGARGPWSLDVGHIVERDQARALGWTDAQINALSNTQPEHQHCSRSAGATYGNRRRGRGRALPTPVEADEW